MQSVLTQSVPCHGLPHTLFDTHLTLEPGLCGMMNPCFLRSCFWKLSLRKEEASTVLCDPSLDWLVEVERCQQHSVSTIPHCRTAHSGIKGTSQLQFTGGGLCCPQSLKLTPKTTQAVTVLRHWALTLAMNSLTL